MSEKKRCAATTKAGKPCPNPAGWSDNPDADYCLMHDDSSVAEAKRQYDRMRGGEATKRVFDTVDFSLRPSDIDTTTYEGQQAFNDALIEHLIASGRVIEFANVLRAINKDQRDLTDKIRKEQHLRGRLKKALETIEQLRTARDG